MGLLASLLGSLFGGVSNVASGYFNFKDAQVDLGKAALNTVATIDEDDASNSQAISHAMVADASSDSWLTRCWRPIIVLGIFGMVLSWWLGYAPPNLDKPMPGALHDLMTMAMSIVGIGYGGRTLEKVMKTINLGAVLKTLADKKIV